ncbi:MAG: exodeoxyribonuclease VII large subunit [Ignavibacteria bacterium]|nr:exodeoxyribonuclease VII large subunit [Ignavibacteria bacterium]
MNVTQDVLTVTEVTRRIKQLLETSFPSATIAGEISNFKRHTSGHIYFTLKDENAQIAAVLWRSRAERLLMSPEDGMKVIVSGRITVYEVRGNYQIEVLSIRPFGVGEFQMAFEYLKRKLAAEGLFDPEHKKPLPEYPERIGIVTSPTGAALQDTLNILRRRMPSVELILIPVRVQGPGAAEEIANAIYEFTEYGRVDVLIVARGGGSLEDLWAFNEEIVARAIYASKIPVVSAIGHEIDFTIADFVADLRAPTPSAAAELVVRDGAVLLDNVRDSWHTIRESMLNMLNHHKGNIRHLLKSYSFNKPIDLLHQFSQRIDEVDRGMAASVAHRFAMIKMNARALHLRLAALDPQLTLKRGYTIVYKDHEIIDSSKLLHAEDVIDIKFQDGDVRSTVS